MAELSIGEKAGRVLKFNLGARNPRVARALGAHGFTEEDLQQGWALLQQLTTTKLDVLSSVIDQRLVGELDAWENRWFPIVEIVLRTNFPNVHAVVFRNLTQTERAEVIVSVSTLLERLDEIGRPTDEGGLGEEGRAARARLERRGLNATTVASARELLTQIGTFESLPDGEDATTETAAEAEQRLWNWYLEWSTIARVAIRDRRLLRALGFLRVVRKAGGEVVEEVVTEEELDETDVDVVEPTDTDPTDPIPTPL